MSNIRWEVVEGFSYADIYLGLDSVINDFFGRLFTELDEFIANGEEFWESGDRVIAFGKY